MGAVKLVTPSGSITLEGEDTAGASTVVIPKAGVGKVLQEVFIEDRTYGSSASYIEADDTIPQITEGIEILTASITPKSATSKLRIEASTHCGETANVQNHVITALFRDTTVDAIVADYESVADAGAIQQSNIVLATEVPSNATTLTTISFRIGIPSAGGGTIQWNGQQGSRILGGAMNTYIKITEIGE